MEITIPSSLLRTAKRACANEAGWQTEQISFEIPRTCRDQPSEQSQTGILPIQINDEFSSSQLKVVEISGDQAAKECHMDIYKYKLNLGLLSLKIWEMQRSTVWTEPKGHPPLQHNEEDISISLFKKCPKSAVRTEPNVGTYW